MSRRPITSHPCLHHRRTYAQASTSLDNISTTSYKSGPAASCYGTCGTRNHGLTRSATGMLRVTACLTWNPTLNLPPSPALLPTHGTTMIVLPDYYLDKKDAYDGQGLLLNFTRNQVAYLTQAVRNLQAAKFEKRQLRYRVICPTKQFFAISPVITMALDGKPVIKKLRKHCTTMLFDPSSRWYVRTPQDQHRWREHNTYQGTVNLYAFLITETSTWIDLPGIHTHTASPLRPLCSQSTRNPP